MALGLGSLKKQDGPKNKKDDKQKTSNEAENYLKKLEEKKANNPDECMFC